MEIYDGTPFRLMGNEGEWTVIPPNEFEFLFLNV